MREKISRGSLKQWQAVSFVLVLIDSISTLISFLLAMLIRYDFSYSAIPKPILERFSSIIIFIIILNIIIYYFAGLYKIIWRFISINELFKIILSVSISIVIHFTIFTVLDKRMPIAYYIFGVILQFLSLFISRFSYRFYLDFSSKIKITNYDAKIKKTMIIGAGNSGQLILKDIKNSTRNYSVECFIDDNKNKWGRLINGVPVVGGRTSIIENAQKFDIDMILLAIPSASSEQKKQILEICRNTGCELKTLPGVYQLVDGQVSVSLLKDVEIEDLLGRNTISILNKKDFVYLSGKTILVTGGGGSIGSELCRQIVNHNPKKLIIFDIYENNAYDIEQELRRKYPKLDLSVLIGSVRDIKRVIDVFRTYKPDIVYHAAAHKHVPLMENSPYEAIKNNVFGTFHVALSALIFKSQKFILISTDKAVNPTNIMGASKRMCEMIIQTMDKVSKTKDINIINKLLVDDRKICEEYLINAMEKGDFITDYVAVRFGNVLGSNGSVIPLFKQQIKEGGPLTVTHPDIIRYFMTISEAVSLVLQAGNMAQGGEIFVLDMGAPVKIDTLARNLIKLSGLEPDIDIKIEYSGLRPGEKLYEEKLMAEEGLKNTDNNLIHIGSPIEFNAWEFCEKLQAMSYLTKEDISNIHSLVEELVETYHSPEADMKKNKMKFERLYTEAK